MQNPYPEATWEDAQRSMDMTNNLFLAAALKKVPRIIFATSNHVMGGYLDQFMMDVSFRLTTELPPLVGMCQQRRSGTRCSLLLLYTFL